MGYALFLTLQEYLADVGRWRSFWARVVCGGAQVNTSDVPQEWEVGVGVGRHSVFCDASLFRVSEIRNPRYGHIGARDVRGKRFFHRYATIIHKTTKISSASTVSYFF